MIDERDDDALEQLKAELAIQPSPGFASAVRARISGETRRPLAGRWFWLVPAGALAAAALILVASHAGTAVPVMPVAPGPETIVVTAPFPLPVFGSRAESASAKAPQTPVAARAPVRAASAEPEVLVPPDQRIALDLLLAAIRDRRVTVPPDRTMATDSDGWLVEPPAIQVQPLTLEPLMPPNGGEREKP